MPRPNAKELFAQAAAAPKQEPAPIEPPEIFRIDTPCFSATVVERNGVLTLDGPESLGDTPLSRVGFRPGDIVLIIRLSAVV